MCSFFGQDYSSLTEELKMKNNLRVERAILKISQQHLAEMTSVSRQTINAVETGKYVPSTILALKIARYIKKPVEEIFVLEVGD